MRYSRQAKRALHTGSKAWRALRQSILVRDLYTCKYCGRIGDESMHVDHVDGNDSNNDTSNLAAMHMECHSLKTMTEDKGNAKRMFGADGAPLGGW